MKATRVSSRRTQSSTIHTAAFSAAVPVSTILPTTSPSPPVHSIPAPSSPPTATPGLSLSSLSPPPKTSPPFAPKPKPAAPKPKPASSRRSSSGQTYPSGPLLCPFGSCLPLNPSDPIPSQLSFETATKLRHHLKLSHPNQQFLPSPSLDPKQFSWCITHSQYFPASHNCATATKSRSAPSSRRASASIFPASLFSGPQSPTLATLPPRKSSSSPAPPNSPPPIPPSQVYPRTLVSIPRDLQDEVKSALSPILSELVKAISLVQHSKVSGLFCQLLDFPGRVLSLRRGGSSHKDTRRIRATIRHNLQLFRSSPSPIAIAPIPALFQPVSMPAAALAAAGAGAPQPLDKGSDSSSATIAHATYLFRSGFIAKSIQSCSATAPIPHSNTLLKRLQELNPSPHPDDPAQFPPQPSAPVTLTAPLNLARLIKSAKALNNGSAPGPSGWTIQHLLWILQDPTLSAPFAILLAYIAEGHLSGDAQRRLLASRLVAIRKAGSTPPPPGSDPDSACPPTKHIRPIAVGEVIYRLVAHYSLRQCGTLPDLFPRIQKGFHRCGVERVIHSITAHLELTASSDSVLIAADYKAAFQNRSRAAIVSSVLGCPQLKPIHRLFWWAYSNSSDLLLFSRDGLLTGNISSSNGVRQGDILASIAFALSMQPLYSSSIVSPAVGHAVIDDLSITGPLDVACRSFDKLVDLSSSAHFPLNLSKCCVFWPHFPRPPPSQLTHWASQHGLSIIKDQDVIPLLGSAVSLDHEALSVWAAKHATDSCRPSFDLLSSPSMSSQMSLTLLRFCSLPRLSHLFRTLPHLCSQPAASLLDSWCLDTVELRLGLKLQPDSPAIKQIAQPLRSGGFGLTSASSSVPFASLASLCGAIPDIAELLASVSKPDPSLAIPFFWSRFSALFDFVNTAHLRASAELPPPCPVVLQNGQPPPFVLPDSAMNLWSRFRDGVLPRGLHRCLQRPALALSTHLFRSSASETDKKRLDCFYGPDHARFLTVIPSNPFYSFSNPVFSNLARFRLGIPPLGMPSGVNCQWCKNFIPPGYYAHPMCCVAHFGPSITARHNLVVSTLLRFAGIAGATTLREPKPFLDNDSERPDLSFSALSSVFVDVAIIQPDAPSRSSTPSQQILAKEHDKERKYVDKLSALGYSFCPAVASAHGVFGSSLTSLIETLSQLHSITFPNAVLTPPFHRQLSDQLACAIQQGNAAILEQATLAFRHHHSLSGPSISNLISPAALSFPPLVSQPSAPVAASSAISSSHPSTSSSTLVSSLSLPGLSLIL